MGNFTSYFDTAGKLRLKRDVVVAPSRTFRVRSYAHDLLPQNELDQVELRTAEVVKRAAFGFLDPMRRDRQPWVNIDAQGKFRVAQFSQPAACADVAQAQIGRPEPAIEIRHHQAPRF